VSHRDTAPPTTDRSTDQSSVLSHSAVMAAGTAVSRLSGFVRAALLSFALGSSVHADVFNVANSLPNMLYILLAGGVFNAVLVPQLIRSQRNDPDGGEAYTNRVVTVAGCFLVVVTVVLVAAAPLVVDLVAPSFTGDVHDSAVAFTRYCLPQVLFYGMYVLVGQILNARGSFGPMMWAPIANNVISVLVILVYVVAFGPARGSEVLGGFTSGQELLLGLGSTLGIAAQLLILVPYLRRAGYVFRPRFDLRDSGLGHTLRLGIWTVLFVIVNQVAYVVVQRLATSGAADSPDGTGFTVYSFSFLVVMVPHSIITVSLATAVLPRLSAYAAAGDLASLGETLTSTLRSALSVIVPFVLLLPFVAADLARIVFAHGAAAGSVAAYVPTLSLFGVGILFFTFHYLVLRGFYALEDNRTAFYVQVAVAATNIVAALVYVARVSPAHTSPALVAAYATAYGVGSLVSYRVLSRRAGGFATRDLVEFVSRLVVAAGLATIVCLPVLWALDRLDDTPGTALAVVRLLVLGVVELVVYLRVAKLLGLGEAAAVVRSMTGRLSRR
jgi:putative peptidoglycan lipid II flippase